MPRLDVSPSWACDRYASHFLQLFRPGTDELVEERYVVDLRDYVPPVGSFDVRFRPCASEFKAQSPTWFLQGVTIPGDGRRTLRLSPHPVRRNLQATADGRPLDGLVSMRDSEGRQLKVLFRGGRAQPFLPSGTYAFVDDSGVLGAPLVVGDGDPAPMSLRRVPELRVRATLDGVPVTPRLRIGDRQWGFPDQPAWAEPLRLADGRYDTIVHGVDHPGVIGGGPAVLDVHAGVGRLELTSRKVHFEPRCQGLPVVDGSWIWADHAYGELWFGEDVRLLASTGRIAPGAVDTAGVARREANAGIVDVQVPPAGVWSPELCFHDVDLRLFLEGEEVLAKGLAGFVEDRRSGERWEFTTPSHVYAPTGLPSWRLPEGSYRLAVRGSHEGKLFLAFQDIEVRGGGVQDVHLDVREVRARGPGTGQDAALLCRDELDLPVHGDGSLWLSPGAYTECYGKHVVDTFEVQTGADPTSTTLEDP